MWPSPTQPWFPLVDADRKATLPAAVIALKTIAERPVGDPTPLLDALTAHLAGEGYTAWTPLATMHGPKGEVVVLTQLRRADRPEAEVPGLVFDVRPAKGGAWAVKVVGYQPATLTGTARHGSVPPRPRPAPPRSAPPPTPWDEARWRTFLPGFSADMIAREERLDQKLDPAVRASGWLGFPPADEATIAAAEARLGTRLPPSLRAFYAVSNGWRNAGWAINELLPVERIGWSKDVLPDVHQALDATGAADDEDLAGVRRALVVTPSHDNAIWMLDPQRRIGEEWAALSLMVEHFGVDVLASFPMLLARARAQLFTPC